VTGEIGKLASFWSSKTSIFTRLAVVAQLAYITALLLLVPIIFIEYKFISWWWVGVVILVTLSVALSLIGRRNLGFLVGMVSILVHLGEAAVNGSWSVFTVSWEVVFSEVLTFDNYLFVASLLFLPIATILLVIGRPEWKLLNRKS
jgi:hypothetical protein